MVGIGIYQAKFLRQARMNNIQSIRILGWSMRNPILDRGGEGSGDAG